MKPALNVYIRGFHTFIMYVNLWRLILCRMKPSLNVYGFHIIIAYVNLQMLILCKMKPSLNVYVWGFHTFIVYVNLQMVILCRMKQNGFHSVHVEWNPFQMSMKPRHLESSNVCMRISLLLVSEANEVPISSRIWVASSAFKLLQNL